MVIKVITKLGHKKIVKNFIQFIIDIIPDKNEKLQIMYGINGEKKLSEKFLPTELEVEDQSHLHANHNEDAKRGGTHFRVFIRSEKFTNIKPIDRHRMAMETLRDEFKNGLHAVSFDLKAIED